MKFKQLLKFLVVGTAFCAGAAHAQVSVMLPANPGGGGTPQDDRLSRP